MKKVITFFFLLNVFFIYSNEASIEAIITFSTPTPQGLIYVLKIIRSSEIEDWLYDIKKIIDFVYISYSGKLKEWTDFFTLKEFLPDNFNSIKFNYEKNKSVLLETNRFSIKPENNVLDLNDEFLMALNYDFYPDNKKIVWDIRRVLFSEDKKDNYFVLYKNIKPDNKLPEDYLKSWNSYINKNHSYNENSFQENGRTNIGTALTKNTKDNANPDIIYTLYFGMEGNIDNLKLSGDLNLLKQNIKILE